ncbi:MAG: hypothetical protein IIZ47_01465 [Erysipelotrichaceae bacterium]|nr:hypothetical protein [Erysipelotrichaceae bacterium]
MKEKNPYESQNTMDIPDFVEAKKEEESQSVNMEVFKLDADEYEEKKPVKRERHVRNNIVLIGAILLAAFMLLSIFSLIYAANQRNALKAKTVEYDALVKKTAEREKDYEAQIQNLKDQIENMSKSSSGETIPDKPVTGETTVWVITASNGVNVRVDHDIESERVRSADNGTQVTVVGELYRDDEGRQWGHLDDGNWLVLINGEEEYADRVQ